MELVLIKDFFIDLFKKLGIAGTIAVFLFGLVAIQHEMIKEKDSKIATLQTKLDDQNAAIEKAGKEKTALQNQLNGAQDQNKILEQKIKQKVQDLQKKPVATTCEGAMSEIRSTMKDISSKWNSQ